MKQGTWINRIVILIIAVAVVVYFAVSAWRSFADPYDTVLSYEYTVEDTVEATGLIVRQESVFPTVDGMVDLIPSEGARVAKSEVVAMIYQSSDALSRKQEIQRLTVELEQLQYARDNFGTSGDSSNMTKQVLSALTSLHSAVQSHAMTGVDEQAQQLKLLVAKQGYSGTGEDTVAALDAALAETKASIQTLEAQAGQDTGKVTASQSGIFSAQVDGFETLITPDMLESLAPDALDKLLKQEVSAPEEGVVGKLITATTWYYVFSLGEEDVGRIWEGGTVTARFSRDWSGEIDMKVEQIGPTADGQTVVVLSTNRFLSETTLLRRQTIELVFDDITGVRLPKKALRMEDTVRTDEETGEQSTVQQIGVYALVGEQAEFKPVTVLYEEGDYCIVKPETPSGSEKKILRAGDDIIVTSGELFDGKVIR
ncbi:MAG: hypothetical protein LIO58_03285 [Oscillospiraceae bacterium]|nr:hypothetical protein [Oscillospiraceae bacterium]